MALYKHILVPTDFSQTSCLAAARAKGLAESLGAKITVLHVIDYFPPGHIAAELPASLASKDAVINRARKTLSEWVENHKLGDYKQQIEAGSPKSEIVTAANDLTVDLIVMGTHGQTGLSRLIGSTANSVIHHAECDVLTTRMT